MYEASFKVAQAEATFAQAQQDLIVRVSQAYFDVLAAQDSLAFIQAQKTAISEQLAQAKRNFEVGTATITDTHEAQSRYDLSVSQGIASEIDLEIKRMIDSAYETVYEILVVRREVMEHLTRELLEKEVMDAKQLNAILDQYKTGPRIAPGTFAAPVPPIAPAEGEPRESDLPDTRDQRVDG